MSQKSLLSPSWYRVAQVRPRLRDDVRISRQSFRGTRWFVLEDHAQNKVHRFTPTAQRAIALMDGHHSVDDIWRALESLGEEKPSQDELIHLLAQLDSADLLATERRPDFTELSHRAERHARQKLMQRIANPIYLRLPLFDPDRFLSATAELVRPLASIWGLLLWLGVIGWAVVHAAANWPALTHDLADRVLARDNIFVLIFTFPLLKLLHELGHGYAAKLGGAEVHEAGVMTLIVMPVPYIDVSASAGFHSKWHRALVAAAGMMVETFCAALALMVWLNVEPGLLRAAAFNWMLIAGVSTLLFNGNPLLRFDGYYILSDLLEVPNLATRAGRFYAWLANRYLFGVRDQASPVSARGEATIFALYAPLATIYRLSVLLSVAMFVATQFHGIGAVLAIWTVASGLVWPILRGAWYLATSPVLRPKRLRALSVTGTCVAAIALLLFVVPLPYGTVTEGVVWAPTGADLHAGTEGRVEALLAEPGSLVTQGQPVVRLADPLLALRVSLLRAQLQEIQLRLRAVEYNDQVQAQTLRQQVTYFSSNLADAEQRQSDLVVRSARAGTLLIDTPQDLTGRYFRRGELIGYALDPHAATIRVIVPQSEIELVRQDATDIALRFASLPDQVWHVSAISREVPTATRDLPSAALSGFGGGEIEVDPGDQKHLKAIEVVFALDVPVPADMAIARIGERVHVRFDHGSRTLGWRLARSARQAVLRRFEL